MGFFTRAFFADKWALALMLIASLALAALAWLDAHPEHDPRAPLSIDDPQGWATGRKLAALRGDPQECRAVLARAEIAFTPLEPAGEGECRREDRLRIAGDEARGLVLSPAAAESNCAVQAGLAWWLRHRVQPAAEAMLGSRVARIEHLGTYSCRRIGGAASGRWSEHAGANAIDIAALVLADGRRISVLRDWSAAQGEGDSEAAFLRAIRDGACDVFGTVLSPDYNAAHEDHLHLDQADRGFGSFCR